MARPLSLVSSSRKQWHPIEGLNGEGLALVRGFYDDRDVATKLCDFDHVMQCMRSAAADGRAPGMTFSQMAYPRFVEDQLLKEKGLCLQVGRSSSVSLTPSDKPYPGFAPDLSVCQEF